MVAAEKNLKRGAAAARRRKSGDGGSESGFDDLRFGPKSPSSPLIRGGGSSRSGGGGWDRRRGDGGSRRRGGGNGAGASGEGIRTAGERPRWRLPLSVPDGLKWRLLRMFFCEWRDWR
jgi:hypothetical protein